MDPLLLLFMPVILHLSSQKRRVAQFFAAAASLVNIIIHSSVALGSRSLFRSRWKHASSLRSWVLLPAHCTFFTKSMCHEAKLFWLTCCAGHRWSAAHVPHRVRGDLWSRCHSARLRHVSNYFSASFFAACDAALQ